MVVALQVHLPLSAMATPKTASIHPATTSLVGVFGFGVVSDLSCRYTTAEYDENRGRGGGEVITRHPTMMMESVTKCFKQPNKDWTEWSIVAFLGFSFGVGLTHCALLPLSPS